MPVSLLTGSFVLATSSTLTREITEYLLRTDQIERRHAWINQHRDFCGFLRHGMLLAASFVSLPLRNGHPGNGCAQSRAA
jgi:hypothetical protein